MRKLWLVVAFVLLLVACESTAEEGSSSTLVPSTEAASLIPTTTVPPTTVSSFTTTTSVTEAEFIVRDLGSVKAQPSLVEAAVDSEGQLVFVFVSVADQGLKLGRCSDLDCSEGVGEVVDLGYPSEPLLLDLIVLPDGSPWVITVTANEPYAVIYSCEGPSCDFVETSEFADLDPCVRPDGSPCQLNVDFPSAAVGIDGLPRIAYVTGMGAVKYATCSNAACTDWTVTTITEPLEEVWVGPTGLHVDSDGRAFVESHRESLDMSEGSVTICIDADCSGSPPTLTFETGFLRTTHPDDDQFLVWWRTGSAFFAPEFGMLEPGDLLTAASDYADIQVSVCTITECGEPLTVDVGETWLLPWTQGLELFTTNSGQTKAVHNHLSQATLDMELQVTECDDPLCEHGVNLGLGIHDVFADSYSMVIDPTDSSIRILYISEDQTLHMLTPRP